jgi:hypothetical protein
MSAITRDARKRKSKAQAEAVLATDAAVFNAVCDWADRSMPEFSDAGVTEDLALRICSCKCGGNQCARATYLRKAYAALFSDDPPAGPGDKAAKCCRHIEEMRDTLKELARHHKKLRARARALVDELHKPDDSHSV